MGNARATNRKHEWAGHSNILGRLGVARITSEGPDAQTPEPSAHPLELAKDKQMKSTFFHRQTAIGGAE